MSKGLVIHNYFVKEGENPFDSVKWQTRTASIKDDNGNVLFEMQDVKAPESWSQLAVDICASKYFYNGEHSIASMIDRVAKAITDYGKDHSYFQTQKDASNFYNELVYLCLNQYGSFNSPVWFNCGVHKRPQVSACFIQSVDDSMDSIMDLATKEAHLFKYGSGSGTDLSSIRSEKEKLSGGGTPSGPLSFLKIYDSVAGVVKSGGVTRRAAKMNLLDCSHPDIKKFIFAKAKEENKAKVLAENGYNGNMNEEAYSSVSFQNENLSVKLSDDFMRAVANDENWSTRWVTDPNRKEDTYKARDVFKWIAEATWQCGDPGVQFCDTINKWNTCANTGRINASNPCSEFLGLDNSACNLASLNLLKFLDESGIFQSGKFQKAVQTFTIAQDILVSLASYPTTEIKKNSIKLRPLGLGYANLGALLMSLGFPYDSQKGRSLARNITGIMHFGAALTSCNLAKAKAPFHEYEKNAGNMLSVMYEHHKTEDDVVSGLEYLKKDLDTLKNMVWTKSRKYGFRNSQFTLLAPTGTIGFMMDCDTTGIEPDIALVKYKKTSDGGLIKMTNNSIERALGTLGYEDSEIKKVVEYIKENDTIEGSLVKQEHLPVFDCAFKPKNGKRSIKPAAHLEMMGAVQPYLSGAISKTVNMPEDCTVKDIMDIYKTGWEMGLKAIAVYRDGCKSSQPLNVSTGNDCPPQRKRMPVTRKSITHKFNIGGHEGYFTVGLFENGEPGELFITMAKEGSTIGGLMDSFGTAISMCLQYGVSLDTLVGKFAHSRFEPSGITQNKDIPMAKSLMDYLFRWLDLEFGDDDCPCKKKNRAKADEGELELIENVSDQYEHLMKDAPACPVCGAITVRNATCYRCPSCGNSLGCS